MGRRETELAGETTALCECGSEDLWEIWSATEYERRIGEQYPGGYGGGADGEYAETGAVEWAHEQL